jgi:hypothetical protein
MNIILRSTQAGNVLFLILIAVVLFAALSYAVTQSSRTGGGDAGREANLISSAEITQYPAAVKTAIVRMIINGITYEQLGFNPPSTFNALSLIESRGVFHPLGGAAAYSQAGSSSMDSDTPGTWYFNPNFEVLYIGTSSSASPDGNEFIAFLPGVKTAVCDKLNEESNGITTIPVASAIASTDVDILHAYTGVGPLSIPNESAEIIGASAGTTGLAGQPQGCFEASDGVNVYYQVIAER